MEVLSLSQESEGTQEPLPEVPEDEDDNVEPSTTNGSHSPKSNDNESSSEQEISRKLSNLGRELSRENLAKLTIPTSPKAEDIDSAMKGNLLDEVRSSCISGRI
jgi:hypothetical protein